MTSEETPLLTTSNDTTLDETIYDRFTPNQKRWIVFVVSIAGVLPMCVQAIFVPSIPQIAKDVYSTQVAVSLSVSLSVFAIAIGELIWAAYSSFYGRRLMYLCGMPLLCVGSCGVAMSMSLRSVLFWRFIQTFGCSGGLSLGAGVMGDICKLEERGTAMGIFLGAALTGLAFAPFIGGAAAQYWSWRNLHYSIATWGLFEMLLIYPSLPETSHPGVRGIDKVSHRRRFYIAWVNPLSSLWLLRSPNLFIVMLASTLVLLSEYVLLLPIAYTIGVRYGITNEAIIGACFLPSGLGSLIGAPIAGRLSDVMVKKWRVRRKGVWYPEDRLRVTWIGGLLVSLSTTASGLLTTYFGGPIGLALNLLCLYGNGTGVDFVMNPVSSYNVDVMHSRSAEAMAAYTSVQALIISAASTVIIPSIRHIGVAWTNIIAAALALTGQGLIFFTIRYGDRMRASMDVDLSTGQ